MTSGNIDHRVVNGFGEEWAEFDQTELPRDELARRFGEYFGMFPFDKLSADAEGFDLGCGSGRWAQLVAPRVGKLHCIDPSDKALDVARRELSRFDNVAFACADTDTIPLAAESQDFGYSLGVLHHIPDTRAAMAACVSKLKPGAPFLVYLYYRFDNRPAWFRAIWWASDVVRKGIARLPFGMRRALAGAIAAGVYWPLTRASLALEKMGRPVSNFPLSYYRRNSWYTMRTDALDRFGTRLEHRFTRPEITAMMTACGLTDVRISDGEPYWVAIGTKC